MYTRVAVGKKLIMANEIGKKCRAGTATAALGAEVLSDGLMKVFNCSQASVNSNTQ